MILPPTPAQAAFAAVRYLVAVAFAAAGVFGLPWFMWLVAAASKSGG